MNKQWLDCFTPQLKFIDEGPGGFAGYASTFGNVDSGGDIVVKGAFSATIPAFLKDGFIALGHDWNGLQIAYPTLAREDEHGLWIEATFHSTPEAQNVRTVMRERLEAGKSVGLSIGYSVKPSGMEFRDDGVRLLKNLDLFETSVVTVPMNMGAGAAGVKGAIPPKKTDTSDGAWDGPANERRLSNDDGAATYRRAYAYVDDGENPDAKSSYRYLHHEIDGDGNVGPANLKACQTGIGVLNGGRGGTVLEGKDREGVYRHLAAHIRDAGDEPPDLKAADDLDVKAMTFADEAEQVLAAVQSFKERAESLAELRRKEGRTFSQRNADTLRTHASALHDIATGIESMVSGDCVGDDCATADNQPVSDATDRPKPKKEYADASDVLAVYEAFLRLESVAVGVAAGD